MPPIIRDKEEGNKEGKEEDKKGEEKVEL